nr:hypothetical protein F19B2.4 - Caenorhabditis elegans [Caenorhabditis elegans]
MVQTVYIFSAISLISLILGFSLGLGLNSSSEWSYYFTMFNLTIFWSLSIIIQVFYILIILLAIEKFTIYFFPSTEKFVMSAQKYQIKHVRYMYLVIFIVQSILTLNAFGVRFWNINEIKIRSIIYISFNIIFILSALLYVPIMFSVRKFSNLPSVQQNKPQLYIFWQTINILIFKFTFIAAFIACLFAQQAFEELVVLMMFLDIVVIPQIVQISYISCNKRNMDTLLKSFSCIKFTRIVFNRQKTTSIAPQDWRLNSNNSKSANYIVYIEKNL